MVPNLGLPFQPPMNFSEFGAPGRAYKIDMLSLIIGKDTPKETSQHKYCININYISQCFVE